MKSHDKVTVTWPPGGVVQVTPMEDGFIQIALKYNDKGSTAVLDPAQAMWLRERIGEIYEHTKGKDNYGS